MVLQQENFEVTLDSYETVLHVLREPLPHAKMFSD